MEKKSCKAKKTYTWGKKEPVGQRKKMEKKREEKYTEYNKSHLAKLYRTLMKDVDGLCAIWRRKTFEQQQQQQLVSTIVRAVICQKQISVEGDGHCCQRPSSNWET